MKNVKILLLLGVMLVNVMPYLKDGKIEWKAVQAQAQQYMTEPLDPGPIPTLPIDPICGILAGQNCRAYTPVCFNLNVYGGWPDCIFMVAATLSGQSPNDLMALYPDGFYDDDTHARAFQYLSQFASITRTRTSTPKEALCHLTDCQSAIIFAFLTGNPAIRNPGVSGSHITMAIGLEKEYGSTETKVLYYDPSGYNYETGDPTTPIPLEQLPYNEENWKVN